MSKVQAVFLFEHSIARQLNTYAIYVDGSRHHERGYPSTRIAHNEEEAVEIFNLTYES
jgi:hypothetical protein